MTAWRNLTPEELRGYETTTGDALADAIEEDALAREKAEQKAELEMLEAALLHIYDPYPYADAIPLGRMYDNTGIGALYGRVGAERFLPELGDWTLGREPRDPATSRKGN